MAATIALDMELEEKEFSEEALQLSKSFCQEPAIQEASCSIFTSVTDHSRRGLWLCSFLRPALKSSSSGRIQSVGG